MQRFEDIIIAQPDVFGPQELSNLVWAMGKLRADAFCPSPRLMSSLSNAILSKLDQFNTQNLLTALQGFARYRPAFPFMESACASSECTPPNRFDILASHIL